MFNLQKFKSWTKSSVSDDKREQEAYQKFQDQINSIKTKSQEYIEDLGYTDERLFVHYNGKYVPINIISSIRENLKFDKNLTTEEKAIKMADLTYLYNQHLKELEERIVGLAIKNSDNVYLAYICSCIKIINSLLKEYSYLLAIKKSGVYSINNENGIDAGQRLKKLKNEIEIRLIEIESRLTIENAKIRY